MSRRALYKGHVVPMDFRTWREIMVLDLVIVRTWDEEVPGFAVLSFSTTGADAHLTATER
jgi:hypothetical protein